MASTAVLAFRKRKGSKLVAITIVPSHPELKRLAGLAADRDQVPLSEFFVRAVAEKLGRPDLAVVPRKKPGRPRKDAVKA